MGGLADGLQGKCSAHVFVVVFVCFFVEKKWSELSEMALIKILLGGKPPPPFLKLFFVGQHYRGVNFFWRVKVLRGLTFVGGQNGKGGFWVLPFADTGAMTPPWRAPVFV
jgi:hypothetical protein